MTTPELLAKIDQTISDHDIAETLAAWRAWDSKRSSAIAHASERSTAGLGQDCEMTRPQKGVPFKIGEETIIPTYVAESEVPRPNGACLTATTVDRPISAAGWYVEFRYVDGGEQYRRFIPFD